MDFGFLLTLVLAPPRLQDKSREDDTRQPSDDSAKECLEETLRLSAQGRVFIILDALDECPDFSGIPTPCNQVLQLVKELVDLRLHGL